MTGLIQLAEQTPAITGLAVHLHIKDSIQMEEALRFARSIMPQKPMIIPEFSLHRLYLQHIADELGDSQKGKAFADKYGYPPTMKTFEWYSRANTQRVGTKEWQDFFDSRTWFPSHFMLTYYRYFQRYRIVLATYGYLSQSAPQKMTAKSPAWFINPIFPFKSLEKNKDGSYAANPLWYEDFCQVSKEGISWRKKEAAAKKSKD